MKKSNKILLGGIVVLGIFIVLGWNSINSQYGGECQIDWWIVVDLTDIKKFDKDKTLTMVKGIILENTNYNNPEFASLVDSLYFRNNTSKPNSVIISSSSWNIAENPMNILIDALSKAEGVMNVSEPNYFGTCP